MKHVHDEHAQSAESTGVENDSQFVQAGSTGVGTMNFTNGTIDHSDLSDPPDLCIDLTAWQFLQQDHSHLEMRHGG